MRPSAYSGPDGVQGPRLSKGIWGPRLCEVLKKRCHLVLNQGRRRSHRLEPTTFDEVVNVRGRVHGGTCDDREVGNWVIARRDGYKEWTVSD